MSKRNNKGVSHKGPAESGAKVPAAPRRPLRPYHLALAAAFIVLLFAYVRLNREMFERYRFNLARYPDLAHGSRWAELTGWMPGSMRAGLTRLVVGSVPLTKPVDAEDYISRLKEAAEVFPYDGILQLELARQLTKQARHRPTLYREALEHNRRVFETYFDVEAYAQMAWIHMELHALEKARKNEEAAKKHLQEAIAQFQRVLLLKPGDINALEHLAYIYSYIASQTKRPEDWRRSMDYAKRLLDEEHDNTNATYFLGIAYDNLGAKERAANYYFRTLDPRSSMPRERRMWNRRVILKHLRTLGFLR